MSSAQVTCANCDKRFEVDTRYFRKFGDDPFCRDCLIHTECQSCNRGLRLEPSRYQELGGDPVACTDCAQQSRAGSSERRSFWAGLTVGEKIVFPILLIAFLGLGGLALYVETNGGETSVPLLSGILILLYWTYRRGKKNAPGS